MTATVQDHRVAVPVGKRGAVEVRHFEVEENSFENLRLMLHGGRQCRPGTYTKLLRNGELWMSDTTAEWDDHRVAYLAMRQYGGRVLINGLGLGMVVKAALDLPNVEHVDVVELDPDVIALVGPTYAGPRCTIHQDDAYTIRWPVGTRWTVAWHDVWLNICGDNLSEMAKLHRRYGGRVQWQGSWAREECEYERRRWG